MMFLDFFDIKIFLFTFAICLHWFYVIRPSPKIIFKYNTTEEENNIIKSESVECPKD